MLNRCNMLKTIKISVATLMIFGLAFGAQPSSDNLDEFVSSSSEMRPMLERFGTDRQGLQRFYNVPMSAVQINRMGRFYSEWQTKLAAVDFDAMGQDGRIDYLMFKNFLDYEVKQLAYDTRRNSEMVSLLPFAQKIVKLEVDRRAMIPVDAEGAAVILTSIQDDITTAQATFGAALKAKGKKARRVLPTQPLANRAANQLRRLKGTLEHWYEYKTAYDPMFTWWNKEPYEATVKAIDGYRKFVNEQLAGIKRGQDPPLIGDPIGRAAILDDIAHEMIPYSPEQLVDIANAEFAWSENELLKATAELGYGNDWRKAMEYVKTLHAPPGGQDDLVKAQALEAIKFLDDNDLVTIPDLARETWRMEMMSPERQMTSPFFLYGGQQIIVSYPTDGMDHEQKQMVMRGNNEHFSRAVTHHELIPGHHLQGFIAQRYNTQRRMFRTPFYSEGWALYWEMLLWDLGFVATPENKIGALFWRMHRSARIIVSLNFHLGKMEPDEMIDFLIDRDGHERHTAASEVRRYIGSSYSPLYQCAYMLGGLQFRAMHKELVQSGTMTNRDFHDTVLKQGAMPVEAVRWKLMNIPLSKTTTTNWKFYGARPGR